MTQKTIAYRCATAGDFGRKAAWAGAWMVVAVVSDLPKCASRVQFLLRTLARRASEGHSSRKAREIPRLRVGLVCLRHFPQQKRLSSPGRAVGPQFVFLCRGDCSPNMGYGRFVLPRAGRRLYHQCMRLPRHLTLDRCGHCRHNYISAHIC